MPFALELELVQCQLLSGYLDELVVDDAMVVRHAVQEKQVVHGKIPQVAPVLPLGIGSYFFRQIDGIGIDQADAAYGAVAQSKLRISGEQVVQHDVLRG